MRAKFSEERFNKTVKKIVKITRFCAKDIKTHRFYSDIQSIFGYEVKCRIEGFLDHKHIRIIEDFATENKLKLCYWCYTIHGEGLYLLFIEVLKDD